MKTNKQRKNKNAKNKYLFARTGPGTDSFKDRDGDTTTVLNVGK